MRFITSRKKWRLLGIIIPIIAISLISWGVNLARTTFRSQTDVTISRKDDFDKMLGDWSIAGKNTKRKCARRKLGGGGPTGTTCAEWEDYYIYTIKFNDSTGAESLCDFQSDHDGDNYFYADMSKCSFKVATAIVNNKAIEDTRFTVDYNLDATQVDFYPANITFDAIINNEKILSVHVYLSGDVKFGAILDRFDYWHQTVGQNALIEIKGDDIPMSDTRAQDDKCVPIEYFDEKRNGSIMKCHNYVIYGLERVSACNIDRGICANTEESNVPEMILLKSYKDLQSLR